ncbi:MAG TPA: hypothetical protein VHT96_05645 [Clostridia bacterium]|nr:hypothetical protein [Clostridia bacterium]
MNNVIKTVISVGIIVVLVFVALKVLGFALQFVLPIAILAFIAYVVYMLVTGKKPEFK